MSLLSRFFWKPLIPALQSLMQRWGRGIQRCRQSGLEGSRAPKAAGQDDVVMSGFWVVGAAEA